MAAEDGIEAGHARSQFEVDIHAVMRQQHHDLRAFLARLVDSELQALFLDAVRPVRHEVARVGDGAVGESLTDDRHRHAIHFLDDVRLEHRVAEVGGLHVLRDHIHLALQDAVFGVLDALRAVGAFPVHGHHVHTQLKAGVDHVLAVAPHRLASALPGIAAVQQQCAGTRGAHLFDQCRQVREAAHLAVGVGRVNIVETGESMRLNRVWLDTEMLEQRVADQMRRQAAHRTDAEIDLRLAEIHRVQLRMGIGDMQQADVAVLRQVVQMACIAGGIAHTVLQQESARRCDGQHLQELATIHVHNICLR